MRILVTSLLILGLFSCQSIKHNKKIKLQWNEIEAWSITGKMAINDGINNGSGKFDWRVSADEFNAAFKAPFGQGSWKIKQNSQGAHLSSNKSSDLFAENAVTLISNELGWSFPLNELKNWLRGFHSNKPLSSHNAPIKTINDSGWTIKYQKWKKTELGLLPIKITATKPPYSVKLIIYAWDFK